MHSARSASAARNLLVLASIGALAACATVHDGGADARVTLSEPIEYISADRLPPDLSDKVARLAAIDPAHPLADEDAGQVLSMFGREDLIAATSKDYRSNHCAPLMPAVDVMDEIVRRARLTSIVIINESHERSEDRGFIADVARRMRPLGYDALGIETLQNNPASTPKQYAPPFVQHPDLPYLEDGDGFYLSEAGFGRLGRQAKSLGYRLVPYEFQADENAAQPATQDQRIAAREEGQARNLASFLRDHPGTKILIHVGYGHAAEVPLPDGTKPMAARLKEKTGIDPLTISQTSCRGGGDMLRLAVAPVDQIPGTFDLIVDHPAAKFVRGRPEWRRLAGDTPVNFPPKLPPKTGWRIIEVRAEGEPATSVPMDRVAIRPGEDIPLMLPPGHYHLRIIDLPRANRNPSKPAS